MTHVPSEDLVLNTTLSQALEQLCRHNEMTLILRLPCPPTPQKTGDLKLRYCVVASVLNFRLNLFYNEITELPESLGQLQKLRKLHLGAPASETLVGFTALEVHLW